MDEIIPWDEWVGVIEPYYPKEKRMGIEKMLRMYLLQIWFNLSEPAMEDAVYDSYARSSMYSELSNANSVIEKSFIVD